MMRKITLPLLAVLLALAPAAFAAVTPQATIIENFEIYQDLNTPPGSPVLADAWSPYDGSPTLTLSGVANGGSQSMQFVYALSGFDVEWASSDISVDFTGMTTITVWYQGLAGNSDDTLSFQLLDGLSVPYQTNLPGGADTIGWNRWDIDISAAGDLSGVDGMVLGVEAAGGDPGSGTLYFDDISVSNGEETVWVGNADNWSTFSNWNNTVPTTAKDSRIPTSPTGGVMPAINTNGEAVHDLLIESGATLDMNNRDLEIAGVLTNNGTIISSRSVGTSGPVSFMMDGGHPGLIIEATTDDSAAVFANQSAQALGTTEVTISTGVSCTATDTTITRCYTIDPAAEGTVDITFFFAPEDLNGLSCSSLALYNYHDGDWQLVASPSDGSTIYQCETANYSIKVQGISDFSPFALAETEPVAINLLDLSAASGVPKLILIAASALMALFTLTALAWLRRSEQHR